MSKKNGLIRTRIEYEGIPILSFETTNKSEFDESIKEFKKKIN